MSAAALVSLARHLQSGEELPELDRDRLAEGLDAFLDGRAETLEAALGLSVEPGQRSARTRLAIEARDEIVRGIAAEFFLGAVPAAQAAAIARRWKRYAAAGWLLERTAASPPPSREGTVEGQLWRAMKARDHVLSERTIRQVLCSAVPKLAAS